MNRYDKRIAITPERVKESLRQEIVLVIPFDDRIVSFSVNRGVPFMLDNNKNQPVGKCISQLAELVRERIAKLEQERLAELVRINSHRILIEEVRMVCQF